VRPMITATTAGVGNAPVSMAEDLIASAVSILSIVVPILLGMVTIGLAAWLIWRWRRRSQTVRTASTTLP
jgi:hypothetical protein